MYKIYIKAVLDTLAEQIIPVLLAFLWATSVLSGKHWVLTIVGTVIYVGTFSLMVLREVSRVKLMKRIDSFLDRRTK